MYQQLKGMGKEISKQDFMTQILASLPNSYQPVINTISLQNRATPKTLKPNIVMESILEEFERLQIEDSQLKSADNPMLAKGGKGKGKKQKFPTSSSGNSTNLDVECWNCGEKGHVRAKCPKKPKKKQFNRKGKDQEAHTSQPQDDYAFSSNLVREALSKMIEKDASGITIYDSGVSAHMSPNWGRFIEFQSIKPKAIKAADKTIFMATGVGHMKIDVPNGKSITSVTLKDGLYCPELGYTLVSLAKCDTTSFMIILKEGACRIQDPKGHQIRHIPQVQGLY